MKAASKVLRIGFIVSAVMLWPAAHAYAGLFGPSNFDECVAKHGKNVKATWIAPLMERSCRAKFPEAGEEDPGLNLDYYDCILKRLPKIDTIKSVSEAQSACEQAHGPKRKPGFEAVKKAWQDEGVVLQAEKAGQYQYLEVDRGGQTIWIAGVADARVGDTIRWSGASPMENYYSKSLERTFEELYFVSRIDVVQ